MSGALASVGLGALATVALLGPQAFSYIGDVLIVPYRAISTIIPDVMIEEIDRYELEITEHPVERGSPITDHSYMRPKEVSMRVGWSNSGNSPGYIDDVYLALRTLQLSRLPFTLYVGRGAYQNMLFASLVVTINEQSSDYSLMVQALFREAIIVDTMAVQVKASSQPSKTSEPDSPSARQPQAVKPATNSTLNQQTRPFNDGFLA